MSISPCQHHGLQLKAEPPAVLKFISSIREPHPLQMPCRLTDIEAHVALSREGLGASGQSLPELEGIICFLP